MNCNEDERLVDVVQLFRQVYDKGHTDFKNKRAKQNAWHTIGNMLDRTAEDCEQRFTILRNRFVTEKRKEVARTALGATGGVHEPSPVYKKLLFLKGFIKSRHTSSNITSKMTSSSPSMCSCAARPSGGAGPSGVVAIMDYETTEELIQAETEDEEPPSKIQRVEEAEDEPSIAKETSNLRAETRTKTKKVLPVEESLPTFEKKNSETISTYLNDKDFSFMHTVALFLKDLPENVRKQKQRQIMKIVFEEDEL